MVVLKYIGFTIVVLFICELLFAFLTGKDVNDD